MTENYATVRHYCELVRKSQKVNESNRTAVRRVLYQERYNFQNAVEIELDRLDQLEGIER